MVVTEAMLQGHRTFTRVLGPKEAVLLQREGHHTFTHTLVPKEVMVLQREGHRTFTLSMVVIPLAASTAGTNPFPGCNAACRINV